MALPDHINDREYQKFEEVDGNPHVRVKGKVTTTGLSIAGRISIVEIDNVSWTPIPANPLPDRNAISIQNQSGQEIKIQYDDQVVGYEGVIVFNGGERYYEVTDEIVIFAKSKNGPCEILVEELS